MMIPGVRGTPEDVRAVILAAKYLSDKEREYGQVTHGKTLDPALGKLMHMRPLRKALSKIKIEE